MLREADVFVLAVDLPEYGLKRGDVGAVVMVHSSEGYEVDFMTLDGETVAVTSLAADKVRPIARGEIAHARNMDVAAR